MSELGVDTAHTGRPQAFTLGQSGSTDAMIVILKDPSSKGFGGVVPWSYSRQGGNERTPAILAEPTAQPDVQDRSLAKTLQVTHGPPIRPLAHQPATTAAGTTGGPMIETSVNLRVFTDPFYSVNTVSGQSNIGGIHLIEDLGLLHPLPQSLIKSRVWLGQQ